MSVLAIDYGLRRIGLALAKDEESPQRLDALINDDRMWERLLDLMEDHDVDLAVVGLPRNLEGDDTPQTALVREFAEELEMVSGCEVLLQDEADTSNIARERLQNQKLDESQIKERLDGEAAVIILEDYLHDQDSLS